MTRKAEHFTQETIEKFREWPDDAAANAYDERLRAIERGHSQTFTELGLILVECEKRQLWRHAVKSDCQPPHSLSDWIADCLPVSNGSAFAALKCARALAHISPAEREEIPRGNQEAMACMSESLAKSEHIKSAAKSMKPQDFRAKIERDHPDQHLEAFKPMRFSPVRSARTVIDHALEIAAVLDEAAGRDDALEKVAQFYIDEHEYEYQETLKHSKIGVKPIIATGAVQ
jgi:hypothetical protein